jgi:hypothetical protein
VRQAIWTAIAAGALVGVPALADIPTEISDNRVAVETAWSVFVEDDPKECWVVSAPQSWTARRGGSDVTSQVTRGEIGLFVTFRPATGVAGEVSFTGGYPFRENSTVTVEIGDDSYTLFVIEDWAWPAPEEDASLVESPEGRRRCRGHRHFVARDNDARHVFADRHHGGPRPGRVALHRVTGAAG